MTDTNIRLVLQPSRSKHQKIRLAQRLRAKGKPESDIKRIVFHPENSPVKGAK